MSRQVLNTTRQTLIAVEVEMADNYFKRLVGLMGRAGLPDHHGLWIVPCNNIHSCFMRFEFDALFLSKDLEVLDMVENMRPWRVSKLVKGAHIVLELPGGTIASTRTEVGDRLELRST